MICVQMTLYSFFLGNLSPTPLNTDLIRRKKPRQMDRLRRTLSFRSKKKENISTDTPSSTLTTKNGNNTKTAEGKPLQWQDDEKSVRVGNCSFHVKVNKIFSRNLL
jgi:hypothetical protein